MAEFAQILIRAKDETKAAFDSASRNLRGLEASAAKLGGLLQAVGVGAGLSVVGLAAFAKSGIDAADNLNDMSTRLGVSVKDLASFKLAAEQSGTSLDGVGTGIARLSKSIGEAEGGNKQLGKALQDLGITARDPKEAFFQLADATERITDPAQRAALLSQVLGKSYGDLVPLLSQGGDALRESAKQSESFADAMAKLAPDADKFNDNLAALKINAAGFAASVLNELVPALNRFAERMGVIKQLSDGGATLGEILTGTASADLPTSIRKVNDELRITQKQLDLMKGDSFDPFGDKKALEEKLARLQTLKATLRDISFKGAMDLAEQQYKKPPPGSGGGTIKPPADSGSKFNVDAMVAEDVSGAWKQADAELKQYLDDRQFVNQGDIERDNAINAIAQEWKDAGAALKQDMLTPLEKFDNRLEYINELWRRGVIDIETYDRATAAAFDDNAPKVAKMSDTAHQLGLTFSSAFEDAIIGGKKFSDVLHGLAQDILRIFARKAVTEPLANAVGGWASSLFPSANGNAFANAPALSAYSGSVVSSPTVFPFANGIGLMGEAGAEAILPLKRGRNGKLGVAMDGGGGNYVDNRVYNIDARGAQAGVSAEIRRAIAESESRAVDRSVTQVKNLNQRGQLRLT